MNEETKTSHFLSAATLAVVALLGLLVGMVAGPFEKTPPQPSVIVRQQDAPLGGLVHNTQESFDAGIAVNGTQVINSSGVYVGALSGTTLTASGAVTLNSTLAVPAARSTLSSLSVTGTSYLNGAVSVSSTFASPNGLATLSSLSVTGTSILTGVTRFGTGKDLNLFTGATSTLDFSSIENGTCSSTTMTVTGATTSASSPSAVFLGLDPTLKSGYATHTTWSAWVAATNLVAVQGCAGTSTPMVDPPTLVFTAAVANFNP